MVIVSVVVMKDLKRFLFCCCGGFGCSGRNGGGGGCGEGVKVVVILP